MFIYRRGGKDLFSVHYDEFWRWMCRFLHSWRRWEIRGRGESLPRTFSLRATNNSSWLIFLLASVIETFLARSLPCLRGHSWINPVIDTYEWRLPVYHLCRLANTHILFHRGANIVHLKNSMTQAVTRSNGWPLEPRISAWTFIFQKTVSLPAVTLLRLGTSTIY